uniref:Uncharacterized protein n=1 Tax=Plectus sambesii TaxID=2011161 RepID=A0A914V890_9BILA
MDISPVNKKGRMDAMSAEVSSLRKKNQKLSQLRDRQLCRKQRTLRAYKKLRLNWKAGKNEIARLKACAHEKDILIAQLKHKELTDRFEADRLFENLQSAATELDSLKREMKDPSLSREAQGMRKSENSKSDMDLLCGQQTSLIKAEIDETADLNCDPKSERRTDLDKESQNLTNNSIELKAELIAIEALNKSLQKELNCAKIKENKSQKAVHMQIKLMSELRQQLKSALEERDLERQKHTLLKSSQEDLEKCQASLDSKENEVSSLKTRLQQVERQLNRERESQKELTRRTVEALQSSLGKKTEECRNLQNELAELKGKFETIQGHLNKNSEELVNRAALISSAKEEIGHLREVNSTSHTTILEQEKVIDNINKQLQSLQKTAGEANSTLKEMLEKKDDELSKCAYQIATAKRDLGRLRNANATANATIEQQNQKIDEQKMQMQSLHSSTVDLKNTFKNETDFYLKQLKTKEKELRTERQLAVQRSREFSDLRQNIETLTIRLNSEMKRSESLESNLVQREYTFATEIKNERAELFKLRAQLAAHVPFPSNSQPSTNDKQNTQAITPSLHEELVYWQSQANDFKKAHDQLLKVIEGKESELARFKHEISCHQTTIEFHQKTIAKLESEKTTSQGKIMQLEQSVYSLATETTCKAQMITEMERRTAALLQGNASKDRHSSDLLRKTASLTTDSVAKDQSIDQLEKKIADLTSELNFKQRKFFEQERKLANLVAESSRNRQIIAELEKKTAALAQEEIFRGGQIIELEATLINEQAKRQRLQDMISRNEEEKRGSVEHKNVNKRANEKLHAEVKERDRQIAQLQYEIGLLKNAISNLNMVFSSVDSSSKTA